MTPPLGANEQVLLDEAARRWHEAQVKRERLVALLEEAKAEVVQTFWVAQGVAGTLLGLHGEAPTEWSWRYDPVTGAAKLDRLGPAPGQEEPK